MAKRAPAAARGGAIVPLLLLVLVAAARAGVVYEQRVTSSGPAGQGQPDATNRVYVQHGRERSEMTVAMAAAAGQLPAAKSQLISITRLDRQVIWYLDPDQKAYSEMTFGELRRAFDAAKGGARDSTGGSARPADTSAVQVERTGRQDMICGAPAEQVILTIASPLADPSLRGASQYIVAELWMATDFPGAAELEAHTKATVDAVGLARMGPEVAQNPFSHLLRRLAEEMKKLDGTAIRTVMSLEIDQAGVAGLSSPAPAHGEGRQVIVSMTSEMTKIESKDVPAALFEIPAGYTKVEPPAPGKKPG